VSVRIVDGPDALPALLDAGWDGLLAADGCRDPLRLLAVLAAHPAPGTRPQIPRAVIVERDGRTVAAAALGTTRERGLVTVRHLGDRLSWFDPEPPAVDEDARAELAAALLGQPGDVLLLGELLAEGPMAGLLRAARPGIETFPEYPTYRVAADVTSSFVSRRRRIVRRAGRRAAEAGTPIRVSVTSAPDEIAAEAARLMEFKARCWEGRDPNVLTGTPEGRAWVIGAIGAVGAAGLARLVRLDVGDRIASMYIGMAWGRRGFGFQTAVDRSFDALPSLGWASLLAFLDHVRDEGVEEVDVASGTDEYKSHVGRADTVVSLRVPLGARGRVYVGAVRTLRRRRSPA